MSMHANTKIKNALVVGVSIYFAIYFFRLPAKMHGILWSYSNFLVSTVASLVSVWTVLLFSGIIVEMVYGDEMDSHMLKCFIFLIVGFAFVIYYVPDFFTMRSS